MSALPAWAEVEPEVCRPSRAGGPGHARETVEYAGGPRLGRLAIGDVVTLTDPDLHARDAVAIVHQVTPGPGETP